MLKIERYVPLDIVPELRDYMHSISDNAPTISFSLESIGGINRLQVSTQHRYIKGYVDEMIDILMKKRTVSI